MFSTLLFILHDATVYRFSLPTRCGSSLITFIQPLHLDQVTRSLPVVLERFFFRTVSYWLPLVPRFLFASPIVLASFFFLFASLFFTCPFSHLLSTIHELVTKTKQQCDDFFFFSLVRVSVLCYDPD